jgi:hypothetical protein
VYRKLEQSPTTFRPSEDPSWCLIRTKEVFLPFSGIRHIPLLLSFEILSRDLSKLSAQLIYSYDHKKRLTIVGIACLTLTALILVLSYRFGGFSSTNMPSVIEILVWPSLLGVGALVSLVRSKRIEFCDDHIIIFNGRSVPQELPYSEVSVIPIMGPRNSGASFRFSSKKQVQGDPTSFSWTITNDRLRSQDNMPLYYWLYTKTTGKKVVFKPSPLEGKWARRIKISLVPVGLIILLAGPYYFWSIPRTTPAEFGAGLVCILVAIVMFMVASFLYQRSKVRIPLSIEDNPTPNTNL